MIRFKILGPVEVERDGEILDLGGRKQKTILGVLIANADTPVSVDRCLQAAWGDDVSSGAVRSLHTYVSNLRGILDPERIGIIEGLDGSYRLNVPQSGSVDWVEFEQVDDEDPGVLESLLELWRGRPFQDIEADWARPMITAWEQKRVSYIEKWADARLNKSDNRTVIETLEIIVQEYPLQESLVQRLMLAQYRTGRQVDALSSYKGLRESLVEELGIDPSPDVQDLEARILSQDPGLLGRPRTPTNVAAPLTETIGRVEESHTLSTFLDVTRLLTITGAGGVGKTTAARDLARAALDDFPDGVWWFELAPINDASVLGPEILGAMRLPPPQTGDSLEYLCRHLSGKGTLLVFDNCEHLIDPVAKIVTKVLGAGEDVQVVATSREPLSVSGELAWTLPPLKSPDESVVSAGELLATDAGSFFVTKAKQASPEFELSNDHVHRIASICRRLDGLPFALELAAARLRSMGISELEGRLDDRFELLTGGSRAEVPHHQTLRGTVEWSYELLAPDEQKLYSDLSVFRGGFTSGAATAVSRLADGYPALDSLVSHSLVVTDRDDETTRYRMLETIREHGEEILERTGRIDEIRRAHLEWVANLVREGARYLETEKGPEWSSRFRRETPNLRAALTYAAGHDPVTGAAICGGLSRYWHAYATELDLESIDESTSFLEEGRRWSLQMLEAELPPKIRARLLTGLGGLLLIRMGRLEEAIDRTREAQQLWAELGDKRNLAWATFYEGIASWSLVPIEKTIEIFGRSLALHEKAGDAFGPFVSLHLRGMAYATAGDLERANTDLFLDIDESLMTPWVAGHVSDARSMMAILEGDRDPEVLSDALEAIDVFGGVPNYGCMCHAIQTVAMYFAAVGELEDAARTLGVVLSIRDRLGMVMPPYEDRTPWIEVLGVSELEESTRVGVMDEGRRMRPNDAIDWVLDRIDTIS